MCLKFSLLSLLLNQSAKQLSESQKSKLAQLKNLHIKHVCLRLKCNQVKYAIITHLDIKNVCTFQSTNKSKYKGTPKWTFIVFITV